ncbi:MAG: hypothetical protein JKP98_19395, partial [Rhodobacteraceae bacterium]|nr:hypothetical protein [Paracoccaceae bacterium]
EQSILVADATKFGRAAPIRLTDPAEIDRLVTDAVPPSPIGAMLRAAEVEVVLAPSDVEAGRAAALPP